MYNTIVNPTTGRKVNIKNKLGQSILKRYIYTLNGGNIIWDNKTNMFKPNSLSLKNMTGGYVRYDPIKGKWYTPTDPTSMSYNYSVLEARLLNFMGVQPGSSLRSDGHVYNLDKWWSNKDNDFGFNTTLKNAILNVFRTSIERVNKLREFLELMHSLRTTVGEIEELKKSINAEPINPLIKKTHDDYAESIENISTFVTQLHLTVSEVARKFEESGQRHRDLHELARKAAYNWMNKCKFMSKPVDPNPNLTDEEEQIVLRLIEEFRKLDPPGDDSLL